MRFKSKSQQGFQIFAVTGVNTISFGIQASSAACKGLLGFAIEREDPAEEQRYFMPGFKVFESIVPVPGEDTRVSTEQHPIQDFIWSDFTAKDGRNYTYHFYPMRGKPKNLARGPAVSIQVRTEKLYTTGEHDVFFNRGVASSQAYTAKFGNRRPDQLEGAKQQEALAWLSRDLDEALLKFIQQAKKGDALRGCFYEFRYPPAAEAFKAAIQRGVDVKLIVDAKENGQKNKKTGKTEPPFPREENLATIKAAGLPKKSIVLREARPNEIQHNKFMVLLKGKARKPAQVWTGSTNLSVGGIHGQTNVGHWLRNEEVADAFHRYWELLETDPGAVRDDPEARQHNAELRTAVEELCDVPVAREDIPKGVSPVFSPRSGPEVLDLYVNLVDEADYNACITLAFGVGKQFKDKLGDNTQDGHLLLMLLEKQDKPGKKNADEFVTLNASQNIYKAWGSYIDDPAYQWARETNARILKFNSHVSYVHSKFLLRDPLGPDPIVVTGSANFSKASTNDSDENMLLIRGNRRVADIYFTEFNRIFFHYYFRAVRQQADEMGKEAPPYQFLADKPEGWLKQYKPRSLRQKRLDMLLEMKGFEP